MRRFSGSRTVSHFAPSLHQLKGRFDKIFEKQAEITLTIITKDVITSDGIFKQSVGARNRVGIGLSYRPARLHSLTELVPWNRFLGSLKV